MRVLMLSWEYPPKIVGGIARHVEEIAWAMAAAGDEVHVVTCEFPGAEPEEIYKGVHIHRVTPHFPADNFVHWVHQLNAAMHDRADALLQEWTAGRTALRRRTDRNGIVIHSHDWLAAFSGIALKNAYRIPLVSTIHATEHGRNSGIHNELQSYISSVERSLTHESWRVIVCSEFMKREVESVLAVPWDKMDTVPNGVHASKFDFPFPAEEAAAFRTRYASPDEKIIMFVGRMVREKGAQVLVESLPLIRAQYGASKLVIVGGGYRDHLVQAAARCGVSDSVYFTGFAPDDDLLRLYRVADVACYPSLYEPFGIVALEAMAAGVPVVVSDAGGLKEIVEHDVTGTITWAGSHESLSWGISRLLRDPDNARRMADVARGVALDRFDWAKIAASTRDVYARVWAEFRQTNW